MSTNFRRTALGACTTVAAVYAAAFTAVRAVFLGESRGPELHVVPQCGFKLYCISSVSLQRPLKSVSNALNIFRFPLCVAHSAWALVRAGPHVLVGTGGKVSVPACVAAAALGIPLVLYEPNAQAGAANQALHVIARQTLLAYDSAAAGLRYKDRCVVVGPAVRSDVLDCVWGGQGAVRRRRRKARAALGVTGRGTRLLLVLGGSGGCGYLNCAVNNALPQLAGVPGLHVLWQTGAKQYVSYSAGYAASLPSVRCVPFLPEPGSALLAADLVLSRAGASTVSELGAVGVPALLVPSPAVSNEQQTANARVLVDKNQAVLVPQVEVDEGGLAPHLLPLLTPTDGRRLAGMRRGSCVDLSSQQKTTGRHNTCNKR
ncbi:hypothetical protein VOLCADRAFT_118337 [Volvox carteri f. nagariensis]|uniref:Glycosyl transferase family 28 C-terminal domain-containing protein n=1 Tax=Volvox carteri f. nagariensis TaxID=3068 RepID=D8U4C8_VOLCA|nr:uncharacterized protein VOLCADRAFT_118337 [Volvox carteri f. nagariensis]EFJ45382.1 hypothetical protein VOLCADRAFT_118337 [Volvox carteri f. nagariensis]|eukprot:XP_002953409.1 hypothetical protein VOLCADRAFT_118337 [Volvox carteri f. nagariensis]